MVINVGDEVAYVRIDHATTRHLQKIQQQLIDGITQTYGKVGLLIMSCSIVPTTRPRVMKPRFSKGNGREEMLQNSERDVRVVT